MTTSTDSAEPWHISRPIIWLSLLAVALAIIIRYTTVKRDPLEPPYIPSNIPFLGHIVHMIREGADYYTRLEKRYRQDIYALPMLGGRMYIVASPEWATAVHRVHKTLHFNTLIAQAMQNLFLLDEPTMAIVNVNLNNEDGTHSGILQEIHDKMLAILAPGPTLDELNTNILNSMAPHVNGLARDGPNNIHLWEWLRHHFSIASVAAIWGPRNPFTLNPAAEPAFWEFESQLMALSMYPFPQVTARKAYNARATLFKAFEEYTDNEYYNDPGTSQLIKKRAEINMGKFGLSKKMYAFGEASLLLGALLNSIPMAFWLISLIFEDAELLKEVRGEIDECITASTTEPKKRVINATKLRSCPLFSSAFRETLRIVGSLNSNRLVSEDTTITNNSTGESYLLKKGSIVQIAGNVIHFKPFWGEDILSFNPRRFMQTGEKARAETTPGKPQDPAAPFRDSSGKIRSNAFRSFGGGVHICPGRYFAQTEILALASLFIAGFEIENTGGKGGYVKPPFQDFKMMMSTIKPGRDVEVNVSRREGFEGVEWGFEM